jgi:Calcineurin-like phosphoesterase
MKMTKERTTAIIGIAAVVAITALLGVSALFPLQANPAIPTSSSSKQANQSNNFSFGTAGDWGSNSDTAATASNIASHQNQIVIGLGDFCYCGSPDSWWNGPLAPINHLMFRGAQGNHDADNSGSSEYLRLFGQNNWTSSFNYKNVHFVPIDTESNTDAAALDKDLATAKQDPNIKWIVAFYHKPIYTSPTNHEPDEAGIKNIVVPLFDKYHVDLVLQAHNHNYQRSYPLKADMVTETRPDSVYQSPKGSIYMVVGTGGQDFYPLNGQAPYIQNQFTAIPGFLKVDVSDTSLKGTFFANDGTIKDTFAINK